MKVLVVGGTGVISRAITMRLLEKNHDVILFNRGSKDLAFTQEVHQITGDRHDVASFQKLRQTSFDVVIDMICFDKNDAVTTLETFAGRVKQIIVCSSSLAYSRPYRSLPIREESEKLRVDPTFGRAFNKAEMERYLVQAAAGHNTAITIIRPSLTFGRGTSGFGVLRQNYGVIDRIKKGKSLLMFDDGNNPWSFTFTQDLAKAFVGAVGNPATYGQQYHATSEERTVWNDVYLELGKILGKEVQIFNLPSQVLYHAAPDLCAHLYFEKTHVGWFDNSKIRRDIPDFQPSISLHDGLLELMDWYETSGSFVDPQKDILEDKLAQIHHRLMADVSGAFQR